MTNTPFAMWLLRSGVTTKQVAETTGLSWSVIRKYKAGLGTPAYVNAKLVSRITGGAVTVDELMDPGSYIGPSPEPA